MKKEIFRAAFVRSIPILCSYIFVSMAYGIMMQNAGFPWFASLFVSLTVYTGAFQFVLITFLSSGASLLTVALTAFLMNSRQTFYSLSFVSDFRAMGRRMPYMVYTMTDESYAVNCSLERDDPDRQDAMFYVAILCRIYWLLGTVLGAVVGQSLPFDLTGIDFCMTALFVILLMDQWAHPERRKPALVGGGIAMICLLIFGSDSFMLPALLITSAVLVILNRREVKQA